jgi:hypothetical protein
MIGDGGVKLQLLVAWDLEQEKLDR